MFFFNYNFLCYYPFIFVFFTDYFSLCLLLKLITAYIRTAVLIIFCLLLKSTFFISLEANLNLQYLCKSQVKQTVEKYFEKQSLITSLTLPPCLAIKFERLSKIAKHPHVKSLSESEGTVRPRSMYCNATHKQ